MCVCHKILNCWFLPTLVSMYTCTCTSKRESEKERDGKNNFFNFLIFSILIFSTLKNLLFYCSIVTWNNECAMYPFRTFIVISHHWSQDSSVTIWWHHMVLSYGNRRDRGVPLGRRSPGQIFQVMSSFGKRVKMGFQNLGSRTEHAFLTVPPIWNYDLLAYNPIISFFYNQHNWIPKCVFNV